MGSIECVLGGAHGMSRRSLDDMGLATLPLTFGRIKLR